MAVTHNQMLAMFGGLVAAIGGMVTALVALRMRRKS